MYKKLINPKFKVLYSGIAALLLLGQSSALLAANISPPYVELDYVRNTVSIYGTEFKPFMAKIKGGYYFWEKIALELQYFDSGEETIGNQSLEVSKMYGYFLRLDSNIQNRVRIYVLAGQVHSTLSLKGPQNDTLDTKDIAFGIGAEEKMQAYDNAYITLEYARLISDEVINMKEISLGIRFEF